MEKLISNMAIIVITLILEGYTRQDCIYKAKKQLGISRLLTEEEKALLAQKIQDRFPGMEISDLIWYINLAESMPDYSSGGGVPPGGDIPDVILPVDLPLGIGGIVFAGAGILLLWRLLR